MFTYKSDKERVSEKKSKFFSRGGRIEDFWFMENILTSRRPLALHYLELQVEIQKGNEIEQDVLCDSKFMLGVMDKLGNSKKSLT